MQFLSTEVLYSSVRLDADLTVVVILVLFVLVHSILKAKVFTPFLEDAALREEATQTRRQQATALQQKADALYEQHQNIVAEAKAQAQEARRSLRIAGLEQKEAQVKAAQQEAQSEYEQKSAELNAQFETSYQKALADVDSLATEIATKILGRKV